MRSEALAALRGLKIVALRASSCASPARVRGRLHLRNAGTLHIGRALVIDGFPLPSKVSVHKGAELIIGSGCYLNYGVDIVATTSITLGDGVLVGPLVSIVDDSVGAAGSVVRGDVPPRTIVAGVPARPVREIEVPEDGWRRR
jgi:acetyltransferase-like isoleucine patch superfamily enzyme